MSSIQSEFGLFLYVIAKRQGKRHETTRMCDISSSHNDLAYIYLRVVDADGNLCPTAEIPLDIKTSGARHIAVAGTGHSYDLHSFRSLTPTTFRGQALLIIQHQEEKGVVNITASSPKFVSNGTFSVVME